MSTITDAPAPGTERYQHIPIGALIASKTNPRTHFDAGYLTELAGSIRDKGLIQPLVVRPNGKAGTFEIVAGECRYRASKEAGLTDVPAIVRTYTDAQVLETQLEENIHRKDLTPLEEAAGYRRLIDSNPTKHSAESIATRIGMSVGYVWDRLKLNDLIPEAKTLLEAERFTVGHAILLSRLKSDDQARAIDPDGASLFNRSKGLWVIDGAAEEATNAKAPLAKYAEVKPTSVREFEQWIRDHIRFDVAHAAQAQPLQFELVARDIEHAAALPGRGKKVIAITHDYRVSDDARAEERTYGSQAWERADGQEKSKTCEHAVLGVVVAGEGQGSTLQVCVARDRCKVHFAAIVQARKKADKQREAGQTKKAAKTEKKAEESSEARWKREQAERERKAKAWKALEPALTPEIVRQVAAIKVLTATHAAALTKVEFDFNKPRLEEHLGKTWFRTPVQAILLMSVLTTWDDSFDGYIKRTAKPFGLDIKRLTAIRDAHEAAAAATTPGKPEASKAPAKKAAKKR
jgi:ParB/RepB/Spo0J family partition protein